MQDQSVANYSPSQSVCCRFSRKIQATNLLRSTRVITHQWPNPPHHFPAFKIPRGLQTKQFARRWLHQHTLEVSTMSDCEKPAAKRSKITSNNSTESGHSMSNRGLALTLSNPASPSPHPLSPPDRIKESARERKELSERKESAKNKHSVMVNCHDGKQKTTIRADRSGATTNRVVFFGNSSPMILFAAQLSSHQWFSLATRTPSSYPPVPIRVNRCHRGVALFHGLVITPKSAVDASGRGLQGCLALNKSADYAASDESDLTSNGPPTPNELKRSTQIADDFAPALSSWRVLQVAFASPHKPD